MKLCLDQFSLTHKVHSCAILTTSRAVLGELLINALILTNIILTLSLTHNSFYLNEHFEFIHHLHSCSFRRLFWGSAQFYKSPPGRSVVGPLLPSAEIGVSPNHVSLSNIFEP